MYGDGESEREIQRFRTHYSEEDKEKQVIATKFTPHDYRTQFPDVLLSALKDSLARLGDFKVDLYQIHAPVHPVEIEVVGKIFIFFFNKTCIVKILIYSKCLG